MTRREQVLAVLLKTFPAGSSLALKPESLELESLQGDDRLEAYKATLFWSDGVAQLVKVPGDVSLAPFTYDDNQNLALSTPPRWVAVMKQDGQGSPDLRLNDPDFRSRRNIAKQAQQLTFGRPLYILYFTLKNA